MLAAATLEVTVTIVRHREASAVAHGLPATLGITSHEVRAEVSFGEGEPCVVYCDQGVLDDLGLDQAETAALYQKCVDAGIAEAKRLAARKTLPDWAVAS